MKQWYSLCPWVATFLFSLAIFIVGMFLLWQGEGGEVIICSHCREMTCFGKSIFSGQPCACSEYWKKIKSKDAGF